jgi:hypothetical protein
MLISVNTLDPNVPVPGKGGVTISSTSSEQAPFIYFDGVSCFGQNGGIIQIELAANVLMPMGGTGVRIDVFQTGHLRCSPTAASQLRDALDKSIAMVQQGLDQPQSIPIVKN